jgi:hypothetical protein
MQHIIVEGNVLMFFNLGGNMNQEELMLFSIVKNKINETVKKGITKDSEIIYKASKDLHLQPTELKAYLTHKTIEAIKEIGR